MDEANYGVNAFNKIRNGLSLIENHSKPSFLKKLLWEVLFGCCNEDLKNLNQNYGSLFFKLDYVCRRHSIKGDVKYSVQSLRKHLSAHSNEISVEDLKEDIGVLCKFISIVFNCDVPADLSGFPLSYPPIEHISHKFKCLRCIVDSVNESDFKVSTSNFKEPFTIQFITTNTDFSYLKDIVKVGSQLNLLDCVVDEKLLIPINIVFEPDYLLNVNSVASCFTEYGHHPLSFILNYFSPKQITQPIVLGNLASSILDDVVHAEDLEKYNVNKTICDFFKDRALDFCACPSFDAASFKNDARNQAFNITHSIDSLFALAKTDKQFSVLEPTLICESLGIQGRVDLMTTDFSLLVEQKSGKNYLIEHQNGSSFQCSENHLVQILLYLGLCKYNFNKSPNAYLLYSKYAAPQNLVRVKLFSLLTEILKFRNQVVYYQLLIADNGFEKVFDLLSPDILNEQHVTTFFFKEYLLPKISGITNTFHNLSQDEKAYFCRMATFVFKEMELSKLGFSDSSSSSDLWNLSLDIKKKSGNILLGLHIIESKKSSKDNGFDTINLSIPSQGEGFLSDFRIGDMVYFYSYPKNSEPDVRKSLIYDAFVVSISLNSMVIHIGDGQQNPDVFETFSDLFAIEHASVDSNYSSSLRGLFEFISSPNYRKELLLGLVSPQNDLSVSLTRNYNKDIDPVLLKAKQAKDYFLLIGPPGTGKTHCALKCIVEEELLSNNNASILLLAYTNRAVDEICSMLKEADLDFIRVSNEFSCDPRFYDNLLSNCFSSTPKMDDLMQILHSKQIFVGTVSYLSSKPFLFNIKHFSLAIIDEASQILETDFVGLLSSHRKDVDVCDIDKFILIGDYKQLPPIVKQSSNDSAIIDSSPLRQLGFINCAESLFSRLLRKENFCKRDFSFGFLNKQGRMHPIVAELSNRLFYFNENISSIGLAHQSDSDYPYINRPNNELEKILATHRLIFISSPDNLNPGSSDNVNEWEAKMVAQVVNAIRYLLDSSIKEISKKVGIIVPYRSQIALIRNALGENDFLIDTVERFQGSQFDFIIYSFTVQQLYQLGFLTKNNFFDSMDPQQREIDPKLNVAITRSRKQLILIGNESVISQNFIFKNVIQYIKDKGGYVNTL